MQMILRLVVAAVFSVICLASASAFPPYGSYGPPYGYGYRYGGFGPYGRPFFRRYAYGFRPYGYWRGLPNGTGYRGRGTFTGGPAGGIPSRN